MAALRSADSAASQDSDGQPDRRDPEADGAHDDSEPANHVHSIFGLAHNAVDAASQMHSKAGMPHREHDVQFPNTSVSTPEPTDA